MTGECLKTLNGHSYKVSSLRLLKNGHLASGSTKEIKIWDLENGQCIMTLNGHNGDIECIEELSNNQLLSGADDGDINIWDLNEKECIKTLKSNSIWIKSLKVFPNDYLLACGGRTIQIWNYIKGLCIRKLEKNHTGLVTCLELTSNYLISCSWDKNICIFDLNTYSRVKVLSGHSSKISCIKISCNTGRLLSGAEDSTFKVWDLDSGKCLQTIEIDSKPNPTDLFKCVNPCFILDEF